MRGLRGTHLFSQQQQHGGGGHIGGCFENWVKKKVPLSSLSPPLVLLSLSKLSKKEEIKVSFAALPSQLLLLFVVLFVVVDCRCCL